MSVEEYIKQKNAEHEENLEPQYVLKDISFYRRRGFGSVHNVVAPFIYNRYNTRVKNLDTQKVYDIPKEYQETNAEKDVIEIILNQVFCPVEVEKIKTDIVINFLMGIRDLESVDEDTIVTKNELGKLTSVLREHYNMCLEEQPNIEQQLQCEDISRESRDF